MYILAYLEHDIVIILASFPQLINIYTIKLTVSTVFMVVTTQREHIPCYVLGIW